MVQTSEMVSSNLTGKNDFIFIFIKRVNIFAYIAYYYSDEWVEKYHQSTPL